MKSSNEPQNGQGGHDPLNLTVEGQEFEWPSQYITGVELKKLAKLPVDAELYLGAKEPWESELISNERRIDLARPEIEEFFVKNKLTITVNKIPYASDKQYITGKQLKKLCGIDEDDEVYLDNSGKYDDELIANDTRVNLARSGVEHFYSKETSKEVMLIVNGSAKKYDKRQISFKDVIVFAYGTYVDNSTMVYTVGYEDGPKENPEGSMTKNSSVFVKNKMIFHATATDKS